MTKIGFKQLFIGTMVLIAILTGCASDTDVIDNNGNEYDAERIVSLRIIDTSSDTERGTRAAGRPICHGEEVAFRSGHLYLLNGQGVIMQHYTISSAPTAGNNVNIDELRAGVDIPAVPTSVRRVVVVGNHQVTPTQMALPVEGNISAVLNQSIEIFSQHCVLDPGINIINCPTTEFTSTGGEQILNGTLYNTGIPHPDTGLRKWRTTVYLTPTVARFEVASITGEQRFVEGSTTVLAPGSIYSFVIDGIFLDRNYRWAQIDGGNINTLLNGGQIPANFTNVVAPFQYDTHNAIHDWNGTGGGLGVGARIAIPNGTFGFRRTPVAPNSPHTCEGVSGCGANHAGNVWGYQLFASSEAGVTAPPRIIIRLRDVRIVNASGNPESRGMQFLTVRGFNKIQDNGMIGTPLQYISPRYVYRVADLFFTEDNLCPYPNCEGIVVDVRISLDRWNEVITEPGIYAEFRQPNLNTELISVTGNTITTTLPPATGGSRQHRYTWQRSPDRNVWTDIVTNVEAPNLLNWNFGSDRPVWLRRVAIDTVTGARIYTSAAMVPR